MVLNAKAIANSFTNSASGQPLPEQRGLGFTCDRSFPISLEGNGQTIVKIGLHAIDEINIDNLTAIDHKKLLRVKLLEKSEISPLEEQVFPML